MSERNMPNPRLIVCVRSLGMSCEPMMVRWVHTWKRTMRSGRMAVVPPSTRRNNPTINVTIPPILHPPRRQFR